MTSVCFRQENGKYEISVTGHADYRESGNDIVCAAASVLSFTLMQALQNERESGNLKRLDMRCGSGDVRIAMEPVPSFRSAAERIVGTVRIGFELLADSYPENVRIL